CGTSSGPRAPAGRPTAGIGTSLLATSVAVGAAADGSGATRAMLRPSGSAPMIAPSFAARRLLSLRTLPAPQVASLRLDGSPSHAAALACGAGDVSAVGGGWPTLGPLSPLVPSVPPRALSNAPSAPGSWPNFITSAPAMTKTARQASATLVLRRNVGEGHNKPNSGCR